MDRNKEKADSLMNNALKMLADAPRRAVENYRKPTPDKWVKIGDTIFHLGTVVTAVSAITASPWVTVASALLTWVGKTITRFAS